VWAEPGDAALLTRPPRRLKFGDAERGWFAERPRPLLLGSVAVVLALVLGDLSVRKPALAVAAVLGVGLVVAVLLRPVVGGLVLVATMPILSGLAPGVPVAHVRLSEVLVGVVGVTVLASVRRCEAVPWSSLDWLLLAYGLAWAAFGVFDAVTLHQSLSINAWATTIGQLQFFLLYRAVRVSLRTHTERKTAVGVLLGAAVPVALLAFLQELRVGPIVRFVNTITGGLSASASIVHQGPGSRATGPFDNWAALAGYLLPLLLVLCALVFAGAIGRHRRGALVVGMCALIGILVTVEISAIVLLVIGLVVLARQYGYERKALRYGAAALVVGALVAAPFLVPRLNQEFSSTAGSSRHAGVPQTLDFRWQVWTTQYIPAVEARPMTGYGAVLPPSIHWPYTESQYLTYLMEGGFPLLVLFGGLAWAMVRKSREAARAEDPFDRAIGRAVLVAVVAMLAMNLIWPFLSNGGMPQVLWCLLAIAIPRPPPRGAAAVEAPVRSLVPAGGAS